MPTQELFPDAQCAVYDYGLWRSHTNSHTSGCVLAPLHAGIASERKSIRHIKKSSNLTKYEDNFNEANPSFKRNLLRQICTLLTTITRHVFQVSFVKFQPAAQEKLSPKDFHG